MESLMYLTATYTDLIFFVSLIRCFMTCPTQQHFAAVKSVLRYLKGTVNYGLFYKKGGVSDLIGLVDSDYVGDIEDSKKGRS